MCRWLKVPFIPSGFSFLSDIRFRPEASWLHPWYFLMPAGSFSQTRNIPKQVPAQRSRKADPPPNVNQPLPYANSSFSYYLTPTRLKGNKVYLIGNKKGEYAIEKKIQTSIGRVQELMASGIRQNIGSMGRCHLHTQFLTYSSLKA